MIQKKKKRTKSESAPAEIESAVMPPKPKPATSTVESARVTTRASNVNKHPGTDAKKTLQVQQRRDPDVIRVEKEKKKELKEAKEAARQAEVAKREVAQQNLEEYRAQQAASIEHDDATYPQQQAKRGQKRKSDITPSAGDDGSEQSVALAKKAKTLPSANPSNPSQLSEKQAATRGRPADGGAADEGTLKTPVPRPRPTTAKGSNAAREARPLRHTGMLFSTSIRIRC